MRSINFEVYLQGSYANRTNLFRDSDVDIIIELTDTFYSDISQLTPAEEILRQNSFPAAPISLADFRQSVIDTLRREYGSSSVVEGNKAVTVKGNGYRLDADVLICASHRDWKYFNGLGAGQHDFVPGVVFWEQNYPYREIVNYPKLHKEHGERKHEQTRQWFKKSVRMFKHARNRLEEKQLLVDGTAPSYFIEGLIYNLHPGAFGNTHQQDFEDCLRYLETYDISADKCQHEQYPLFGTTPEQWDLDKANEFTKAVRYLWDNWYAI